MKKVLTLLVIAAIAAGPAHACLNYYGIDEYGRQHLYEDYPPTHIYLSPKEDVKDLKQMLKWYDESPDSTRHEYMSDYAAKLITVGCNMEALGILRYLVNKHPGEYRVNANIAVAFELGGNLDSAIYYQRIAMKQYPHSHNNSEWVHLQILEAAIALRDGKVNYDNVKVLTIPTGKSDTIAYQIGDQLKERVPLTKPTNQLLSKVLEESADFYRAEISVQWAMELYAMAIGYSGDESVNARLWEKIRSTRAAYQQLKNGSRRDGRDRDYLSPKWKTEVNEIINQWRNYKPYKYEGRIREFSVVILNPYRESVYEV